MKKRIIVGIIFLCGVVRASDVLEGKIECAPKQKVLVDTAEFEDLYSSYEGSSVRKPRIPLVPTSQYFDEAEEYLNLDCFERCCLQKKDSCCIITWAALRLLCRCLSLGVASNESCGICTGCDCVEGTTREKKLKSPSPLVIDKSPPFLISSRSTEV